MTNHILSVVVAFVAYSILDLAKAVQKIAFDRSGSNRLAAALIWLAATGSTTVSSLLLLYAVSLGSVLVVGAMGGTGLASLTLFSALVMKEEVQPRDILGVALILLGPVALASFSGTHSPVPRIDRLFIYFAAVGLLYLLAIATFRRRDSLVGLLIGGFAGAIGGFVLLFQKVSTTGSGRSVAWISALETSVSSPVLARILEVLVNPYAVGWILLSIISTVVLQFAYRHDRAIRIVPVFAANTILIPVIGGLLSFQDRLHAVQWVGVVVIVVGAGLITVKPGAGRQ